MSKPLLLFTGPPGTRSGYGDHARDLLTALIAMDRYDIRIMDLRWGSTPRNALKVNNPDHKEILDRIVKDGKLPRQPEIAMHLSVPNEFNPIGKYNIGITAGIETTMCSAEWVEGMNRMHMNIVPSNHVKQVFQQSVWTQRNQQGQPVKEVKLEKPIEVLFEGAKLDIYRRLKKGEDVPKALMDEMKNVKTSFNFLFVGHWLKGDIGQDRKDLGMLIKVFLESFKNMDKSPGLILKTSGATFSIMDRQEIQMKLDAIKANIKADKLPPVYILHGELSDEEMNALYNHPKVKAHISFTKGEGFGRPLLEASLSGKPVIASGFSGQVDFLNPNLSTLLPGNLAPVHQSAVWDKVIIPESKWFTVNYNYASAVMKAVYRDYKQYEVKSRKQMELNKAQFSHKKMIQKFEEILDQYLPEFPKEVAMNLPGLPQLKKKGEEPKEDQQITLPKLSKKPVEEKATGLKTEAEEPAHGSGEAPENEFNNIKLPEVTLLGSGGDEKIETEESASKEKE